MILLRALTFLLVGPTVTTAFVSSNNKMKQHSMKLNASSSGGKGLDDRRSFLKNMKAGIIGTTAAIAFGSNSNNVANAVETRQGIEVTAFNGLIFNYRGGGFGGLDASELNEPSVSYADFFERLQKGEVEFVEFLAPDGDAAYVTFKPTVSENGTTGEKENPIRIGEGYPIEQHDGYSSPAFCVRAVKNAGVPYKFTVPALSKFQS